MRQLLLHAHDGHVEADEGAGVRGLGRAVAVRPRQPHAYRGHQLGLPAASPAVRSRPADPVREGGFDGQVILIRLASVFVHVWRQWFASFRLLVGAVRCETSESQRIFVLFVGVGAALGYNTGGVFRPGYVHTAPNGVLYTLAFRLTRPMQKSMLLSTAFAQGFIKATFFCGFDVIFWRGKNFADFVQTT